MLTERPEIRLPRESDRRPFVEMSCNDEFMVTAPIGDADEAIARLHGLPCTLRWVIANSP